MKLLFLKKKKKIIKKALKSFENPQNTAFLYALREQISAEKRHQKDMQAVRQAEVTSHNLARKKDFGSTKRKKSCVD